MTSWLSSTRYSPIGVEIGERVVQLIQFTADHKRVVDAVRWDLPESLAQEPKARARQVAQAVRQACEGRRFKGREAVFCLSAGDLFVQNLRVPKGPANDLQRTVQQEATTRLPFPAVDAEIRFLTAGDVRQGDQTRREIILLACHRPVIDNLMATVEHSGLWAVAVDVEPAALLRSYVSQLRRDEDKSQRLMFVRVGVTNTVVVISQGREVFFIKYLDVSGQQMDQAVADHLKIPLDEATALRRHNGDRRSDQRDPDIARAVAEATRGVIERLASEVALCFRYHSVTFRGQTLARLILGGNEAVPTIADFLSQRLDIKCELGDPLRSYESNLPTARRGQWDVAAGLALKTHN